MGKHTKRSVVYWLQIPKVHKIQLYAVRHWSTLKMAQDDEYIWLKEFGAEELKTTALQAIPFKKIYLLKDQYLFPLGCQLPRCKLPALLWTPIAHALPVELPNENFNYFGHEERITFKLEPAEEEEQPFGLLVTLQLLQNYIETAPAIRLETLTWVILKKQFAFIIGKPLLPIKGFSYWRKNQFLLPTGFDFSSDLMAEAFAQKLNLSNSNDWVFFNRDTSFIRIPAKNIQPLSRSSFRLSIS